jgi:hypothetical protein
VSVRKNAGTPGSAVPPTGTPVAERVANNVQALEAWYAAEFERRLSELSEILRTELETQIKELREEYERLSQTQQDQPVAPPPTLDGNPTEKLLEEIKRTEAVAQKCAAELERMVGDDSVNLGLLLQMRNNQIEVKAYLRGLKFFVENGRSATPNPATKI